MKRMRALYSSLAVATAGIFWVALPAASRDADPAPAVVVGPDDIGGVVRGPAGPEAGVWVIAETSDLPTKFAKIVVTDDQGRYMLPDLPAARYGVWVRGYGLIDSQKTNARPGQTLNLRAVPAPSPRRAAEIYPAGYWFSMMKVPAESEFPGTGPQGNGISPNMRTQAEYLRQLKDGGCMACHALGTNVPREVLVSLVSFHWRV